MEKKMVKEKNIIVLKIFMKNSLKIIIKKMTLLPNNYSKIKY